MAKVRYTSKPVPQAYLPIIGQANEVLERFAAQRMKITLRGLYYRFIAGDLLPASWADPVYNAKQGLDPETKNTQKNYKRLGNIVAEGRMAGLIDWNHLEDSGRNTESNFHWDDYEEESPVDMIKGQADSFSLDKWSNSPYHVEVMVEKDAIEGIVKPVCQRFDVAFTSNRGYSSITLQRDSGLRLANAIRLGKEVRVLYVGDHDPSGLDMDRELGVKMNLFSASRISVQRLALTRDQIDQYDPPTNPAKLTDSRSTAYIEEHGDDSWEVDALDPEVLAETVADAIRPFVDDELRTEITDREEARKAKLYEIADRVQEMLDDEE